MSRLSKVNLVPDFMFGLALAIADTTWEKLDLWYTAATYELEPFSGRLSSSDRTFPWLII